MIVTESFVFIHMHKTGGQTLNDVITRCMPDARMVGYHYPRSEVPPELTDLPVVGIVRNPWDWYVSWYAFNKRPNIHNQLFHVVADGGRAGFKETISRLVNLGADGPGHAARRADLVSRLPETLDGNRGAGLTRSSIRDLAESGSGYYSWLFDRMIGAAGDDRACVGRFENLQQDFVAIMNRLAVPQAGALGEALAVHKRKNTSRHSHYSHYYDDELRDLVATRDHRLIEAWDYRFDSVKPAGAVYDFPADLYATGNRGFRKLLGRTSNYLGLHDGLDIGPLRSRVEQITEEKWRESERERLFDVHRDTEALLLVHFEDHKYVEPDYRPLYFDLQDALQPVVDYIARYYQDNGFVVRLLLAKLKPGGRIPPHTDAGYSLLNCHRIHLPVTTNYGVVFMIGGEARHMRAGELWEINNGTVHAVENRGTEDRIHLIVDWVPNPDGRPVRDVLAPEIPEGMDADAATAATANAMIARARQLQQAGQLDKAESLYRQVLHFDENHVIANNLLGLLCLQAGRQEEAVRLIERALAVTPADPQAHSNLALALNALDRHQEAERHFHESLKLAPSNPKTYLNLGNVYVRMSRIKDAITCYRQALEIRPDLVEGHYNLGSALLLLHRYAEAVESLKRCVELRPDLAEGQTRLFQALQGLQNQERATPG
ncbi:MAG: tetratricopeptide repeat protein [Gammaproteobacteria bacterium]|nr:tetratricopeptide repeat protein [Gammaproteobacteria bacterium]MDH4255692.1 tetratricopeptide repeat protein [Gammaproteobacteria bacterium]